MDAQRIKGMPYTKISTSHQITIPKQVFDDLKLQAGDIVEIVSTGDEAVLIPKRVVNTKSVASLSEAEQKVLPAIKSKIEVISKDIVNSKGLTPKEADIAAKVGLIDPQQRWWYLEAWQKDEREAEAAIKNGDMSKPFSDADEALNYLKTAKV